VTVRTIDGVEPGSTTVEASLGRDGQLYSRVGKKWLDFLDPALVLQYEQLRSELISMYYDSVVPVYITEQVAEEVQDSPKKLLGRIAIGHKKAPDMRRLVLARTRILMENLGDVEAELAEVESETSKKPMTKHEVTQHIRTLPSNFRAGPRAREMCREDLGIELAEYGETYVRKHIRGEIETKTKGYKASFAAGKIAIKRFRGN
jgi:hypothetical protein